MLQNDNYASHGTGSCYNQCSHWVQVSSSIFPGSTPSPVSTFGGKIYTITLNAMLVSTGPLVPPLTKSRLLGIRTIFDESD